MRRFRLVWAVMAAGILAAGGCGRQSLVVTEAPAHASRDTFVYQSIGYPRAAARSGARVAAAAPAPAPVRVEPPLPAHDAAWEASAAARPWRWIVIHHSATDVGSAAAFDVFHRTKRGWDELGYHFVIGNGGGVTDGLVEVGPRWPKQKWGAHCRVGDNEEYNYFGIGICLVGNFETHRPSEAQMDALARLVDYLSARYGIDEAHIIGHSKVGDTRCPGRHFSFDDLLGRLTRARVARAAS